MTCPYCDLVFMTERGLLAHQKKVHVWVVNK